MISFWRLFHLEFSCEPRTKMHPLAVLTDLLLVTVVTGSSGSLLLESSVSRCSLFGNDHIKTFDGSFYSFAGDCSYLLAGDCHKHSFTLLGNYKEGEKIGFSLYLGEYFNLHFLLDGSVTQEDKRVSIPFASNGIFIEKEAGYHKISSNDYGFVVKIDIGGNIQIFLQEKYYNKTCGLCGNFNKFAEDDFRTQEGSLVGNIYDFANSWALRSENKLCKRVQTPSSMCNVSSDIAEKDVMETCELLRTSLTFAQCHHLVDPEPYIYLCERDICSSTYSMNGHCLVFLDYARNCAHEGVILDGWPEESSCKPRCPVGMEYKACISPCAKTCQSLNINEVCHGQCVDGCSCPEGKLLDGEHCVEISDCSCIHSGRHYPPGFTIFQDCNSCICRHGIWICSNGECPGECSITGQSHFKSFDNKHFTFSGICQYLFAKDCVENSFSVIIETVQCADDPDAVCTRSASVRIRDMGNSLIKMKHGGGVSLNGQDIQTPFLQGTLRIQRVVRTSVRLTYGEDLQIDWDGRGELLVKVSLTYTEKMCGLCGNYNGNQGDDFLTPSGLVEVLLEDFGNSWKLNADCQDLLKQDNDPCNLNPHLAKYAEESCSVLISSVFEPCHHEVSPTPYVKNCHFDVCSCFSGKDCLCSSITNYATACARKNVVVQWRAPDFCPMTCPEGQIYQQCGTLCNQTCRSLSFPDENCDEFCTEGCYCPPGHYLDESEECVPKSQCSCYYDGEIFQPEDIFSDHYTMCYCEDGFMHCSKSRAPGALLPDVFADEKPSARIKRSLTCRSPMVTLICPENNPRAEGLECAKTCQNFDLECISHGCISGCLCPKGMVRHENKCVAPERCPCFHNGREYAKGETVTKDCNTCVCHGRKWECTKNICDGTCTVIGPAHYLTFDGMKYKFPGECQYVLVQDFCKNNSGTFRILISNEGCSFTGEKCTKRVIILYKGGEIELLDGNVNIKVSPKDSNDLEVMKSGRYYIILLRESITVTWDLAMGVSVILKANFNDQVCGLCGNFDGIQNNDLTSSNEHLEVDPVDFGNSWKVNTHCADVEKFNWEQALVSPLCNDNVLKQVMVETSCNILSGDLFEECKKLVNPEPYVDICMYDTCACESIGDCACFCDAIAAYAHVCAQKGVIVHWRSRDLCPQSCENLNKQELDNQCEWRYNSCGPACPITCQHTQPLKCPLQCVEGCHVHCPAGKILDELSLDCVSPEDCPVCAVGDVKIPHGRRVVLNRDHPQHCQSCLCEGKNLSCVSCGPVEEILTLTTPAPEEDRELAPSEYSCSKMMDLAFLVDGSNKLSEEDFEQLKTFITGMMNKLHISQKKIRVSILLYRAGPTIYLGLKDIKTQSQMKKIVRSIKYTGDEVASVAEVLKYIVFQVFGKAERTNAAQIAMLFVASKSPGKVRTIIPALKKKNITVIPVGIGPHVNVEQIRFIEKQLHTRAFQMNNVLELMDNRDLLIDYLCDLGPAESSPVPTPTMSNDIFTQRVLTVPPHFSENPTTRSLDIAFVVEGSDNVGLENFNIIKKFLEKVLREMNIGQENIHVTVMQYSDTITLEYSFREIQSKESIIEKVRSIPYQGGKATNTGHALDYISKHTFTSANGGRQNVPHLVYMVSSNPSTDVITRHPMSINVIPIGITPNANVQELRMISQPNRPIILQSYSTLIEEAPELVLQSCCSHKTWTEIPELCNKPMDVIFLLDGSPNIGASEFEEMKNFVQAFIERADISNTSVHVSVLQYARENNLEISLNKPQETENLIKMVHSIKQREQGPTRLGKAIDFVVQNALSESYGGRPSASKVIIVIVSGKSEDTMETAALTARMNKVSLFLIGVGNGYDEQQLRTLTGPSAVNRIMKLQNFEDLSTMVTLNSEFIHKVCMDPVRECIDEDGNKKKPGDKWTLLDQCHTVTCFPGDYTVLETHQINCERMPKPVCHSNLPAVKVEETCGCRWMCPCVCMGSSSRHIVTFDGLNFKLTSNCSYTLFQDIQHDVEVLLHEGLCRAIPKMNCMDAIEVKHHGVSIQLFSNMTVTVNGESIHIPYSSSLFEVTVYGAIMHEIKFSHLRHNLTFTPRNNEFILKLNPKSFSPEAQGLCGVCDQNHANDFMLRDGTVTANSDAFIQEWTVKEQGKDCEIQREDDECSEHATSHCHLLLSDQFSACHRIIPPDMFYEACEESSCYEEEACEMITSYAHICRENGICIDWRTPEFCPMKCPAYLVYDHCHKACIKICENSTSLSVCKDYPTEGCFCPNGQVVFNDSCVGEEVCTQCISEDGTHHQHMEIWIPSSEPCKICTCLDNREVNCTLRPCTAIKTVQCGPCEVPRLRRDPNQCCPVYECVCDLVSCDLPPVPDCEFGLQLALTNPGECRPNYTCACNREACSLVQRPFCPSHRELIVQKTECCDKYECACNCSNSTMTCPLGYLSRSLTNDCGCISTTCVPDMVCVHNNIVYPIGKTWKNGCKECSCTSMRDDITGFQMMECHDKICNTFCSRGYNYIVQDGECCGRCQKTACEEQPFWSRGDADPRLYEVGTEWQSPFNRCIINECVRVNDEVFVQQKNLSCSHMDVPDCPDGTQLRCDKVIDCCPSCRCVPMNGCPLNGTLIGPWKRMMVDQCTTCICSLQSVSSSRRYSLTCTKFSCEPCPTNYRRQEISGSCCGKCVPTSCGIRLRDGRFQYLQPNESLQDGCDSHFCKINEKGEFIWERRITGCPPFDPRRCLAEGGRIAKLGNTCCDTCVEEECRPISTRLQYKNINGCVGEKEVPISHCEGKCRSSTRYSIQTEKWEDMCSCCTATRTTTVAIPVHCPNGTVVQHYIPSASQCECSLRKCTDLNRQKAATSSRGYFLGYNSKYLTVPQNRPSLHSSGISGSLEAPSCVDTDCSSIINNYLDGTQREAMDSMSGMHFSDSNRKVDYVLVYHYRKRLTQHSPGAGSPGPIHTAASMAIVSNGETKKGGLNLQQDNGQHTPQEAQVIELDPLDTLEEEKRLQREEYECNLVAAGLEIEKDIENKSQGLNFVRIHATWQVLSREAELLKIKMPTKKMYEIKKEEGIIKKLSEIWCKLSEPLQPQVPQEDTRMKSLSYPFSREKMYLYNIRDKDTFFDNATRSRIVHEILKRTSTKTRNSMGISTLIANNVYEAAYPLHDGEYEYQNDDMNERKLLYREWARYGVFYKFQPIDLIRKYFGEKIGLYFAWLGLYTEFLIPSSVVGIIVFLYGCITIESDIPSKEMCDKHNTFTMCPLCDKFCDYWNLSSACSTARASHLFDNPATVFFSIFMALWATMFLEQWKRLQMRLSYFWDLTGLEEEERPRPEYETKLLQKKLKNKNMNTENTNEDGEDKLTWNDRMPGYAANFGLILFMITLTFSAVFGVIVYRITTSAALSFNTNETTRSNVRVTVTATAVIINLIVILILDEIYGAVAKWLTEIEMPKTEKTFEERLILKAFLLKFVNSYAPIFYVAFFKGRFVGRPGHYVYVFDGYRMEECAPGGCLMELCIQLSIIMLGKQLIQNNLFEIGIPKLKKLFRKMKDERTEPKEMDTNQPKDPQQWDLDYRLEPFTGLTPEYMEMIIQFGFVTLFVASFPLAPLFALLNNIIEVRLDAKKFVTELRRPDTVRAKDIGIWYNILSGIGKLSVIINAFVIAVTSDFIPRLMYQYAYSQNGSMHGFINHTLSYFNVSHLKAGTQPENSPFAQDILFCRFKDYREPPWSPNHYEFSKQYWAVLSARLAFVILFQNLVMFLSVLVDWMIPDIPKDISEQIKKEKSVLVDFFLKEEHKKLKLIESFITCDKHKHESGTKDQRIRAASFSQFKQSQKGSIVSFSSQHTEV